MSDFCDSRSMPETRFEWPKASFKPKFRTGTDASVFTTDASSAS
jgi:hypothetical protein